MKSRLATIVILCTLTGAIFAEPANDQARGLVVAELVTDTGTRVQFIEAREGRIAIVEEGGPGQRSGLAGGVREEEPIDTYKRLSKGKPVPPGLRIAHERGQQVRSRGVPQNTEQFEPPDLGPPDDGKPATTDANEGIQTRGVKIGSSSCNTSTWESGYCQYRGDYNWCWLDRSGSTTYTQRAGRMHSRVCAKRGKVHLTFKVYEWGSWWTYVTRDVRQGNWVIVEGPRLWFGGYERSQVTNASGDTYHHSGMGTR